MNKKIVFFDLDGTVWDWKGIIPESAKKAIIKLKENGHVPVICTGRARAHVYYEALDKIGFPGMIAACGAHVEYEGKMLHESYLPNERVKDIVARSIKYKVPIVLEGAKKHWVSPKGFERDSFVDRMVDEMGDRIIWFDDYTEDMKVNKFAGDVLVGSDYEAFKEGLADNLFWIEHDNGWEALQSDGKDENLVVGVFEGLPLGNSKANGIKILCDYLGVDPKDTYGFGDSKNDIDMIEYVGTGIAMGDGAETLKSIADYVTTPLWEDGIWNALEHFNLI